jgi:predicted nucleic acid-binding protein
MIYLDSSVALAHLLSETRAPRPELWDQDLVSSQLLEYELWNRIHARKLASSHGRVVQELLLGVSLIDLTPHVLARALEPFPVAVRTLDALHLASLEYLRVRGVRVELATYDERMADGARALGVPLWT